MFTGLVVVAHVAEVGSPGRAHARTNRRTGARTNLNLDLRRRPSRPNVCAVRREPRSDGRSERVLSGNDRPNARVRRLELLRPKLRPDTTGEPQRSRRYFRQRSGRVQGHLLEVLCPSRPLLDAREVVPCNVERDIDDERTRDEFDHIQHATCPLCRCERDSLVGSTTVPVATGAGYRWRIRSVREQFPGS